MRKTDDDDRNNNIARHGIVEPDEITGVEGGIIRWGKKRTIRYVPTYYPVYIHAEQAQLSDALPVPQEKEELE